MAIKGVVCLAATLIFALGASGHPDDEMGAHGSESLADQEPKTYPETYFTLGTHQLAIRAHISLMILSWFIILPIATMLSLARSRYTTYARLGLITTNVIGVLFGVSYKANTLDLYPGSAHSAVGWIVTCIAAGQMGHLLVRPILRLFYKAMGREDEKRTQYSLAPMREVPNHDAQSLLSRRRSFDVEATRPSLENQETPSDLHLYQQDPRDSGFGSGDDTCHGDHEPSAATSKMSSKPTMNRTQRLLRVVFNSMDRIILIVAFVAFCTGIATYWGLFKENEIFNGVAHWIKGGIFVWLGMFNLGRWCGCFAENGWAWNIRPSHSRRQSWWSFEFVESLLVFFYGSTNIFLEHLAGWGKPWTARDLEHVSLTVLFIGGGLCGILVEYTRVKDSRQQKEAPQLQNMPPNWSNETLDEHAELKPAGIAINPLPALVIFFMGRSMASHKQASMISTMVHNQWGTLLGAASVFRLMTYVILYLKPPTSSSPSRPPTELIAAFCFISGGLLFMASSRDTVEGMIHFGVDPMALYTVTMGFTGVIMAWIVILLALKDRASR